MPPGRDVTQLLPQVTLCQVTISNLHFSNQLQVGHQSYFYKSVVYLPAPSCHHRPGTVFLGAIDVVLPDCQSVTQMIQFTSNKD